MCLTNCRGCYLQGIRKLYHYFLNVMYFLLKQESERTVFRVSQRAIRHGLEINHTLLVGPFSNTCWCSMRSPHKISGKLCPSFILTSWKRGGLDWSSGGQIQSPCNLHTDAVPLVCDYIGYEWLNAACNGKCFERLGVLVWQSTIYIY